GDGATNIGEFHEGLNLAMLWKLPVIFLCENNLYGMGTAVARASSVLQIQAKAAAYGMPARQVDGMEILAVREAIREAVDLVRSGAGPQFVEAMTYRFVGHS